MVETTFPLVDVTFLLHSLMNVAADVRRKLREPPDSELAEIPPPVPIAQPTPDARKLLPVAEYLGGLSPRRAPCASAFRSSAS